ncbi:MAG: efflux RND transporter periplasmic adaptor subunit [Xanthobacteraceae bacterium]|nr:efflux RND transporter periplasmic adaptor subunit [Xanthobacteraceae bacterium]
MNILQKASDLISSAEAKFAPRTTVEGPTSHAPPRVRMTRWFIIVGSGLAVLVFLIVGFNAFRNHMIAQFFANMKPPAVNVAVVEAKNEVVPHLLTAIGDLAAVHQVDVSADVSGRVTKILFEAGSRVKAGDPLVQLYDDPEQADLLSFKAQTVAAQLSLDRAKALLAKSFGPQATVDQAQSVYDQAAAGVAKTQAVISQKLVRAPFDGELGVRRVEVGQFLSAGTVIVSLTDLNQVYLNFTITEKDRALLDIGQTVNVLVDAYPKRNFEGKITTIEPQISTETRNVRVQATLENPDGVLKPGMFASTSVVLPPAPPQTTVPETAVDYTLYGDSAFVVKENKTDDGKTTLTAVRTPVKTGTRSGGQVVVLSGIKPGDRIVAVGQLKLQSGAPVTISSDPPPPIPAETPRY